MAPIHFGFTGQTAFVTGAGSGIGRAIALELSRSGAAVGCVDVTSTGAIETADSIRDAGGSALADLVTWPGGVVPDFARTAAGERAIKSAVRRMAKGLMRAASISSPT